MPVTARGPSREGPGWGSLRPGHAGARRVQRSALSIGAREPPIPEQGGEGRCAAAGTPASSPRGPCGRAVGARSAVAPEQMTGKEQGVRMAGGALLWEVPRGGVGAGVQGPGGCFEETVRPRVEGRPMRRSTCLQEQSHSLNFSQKVPAVRAGAGLALG